MRHRFICAAVALSVCASAYASIPDSERNALMAIYNNNGGPNWTDKTGWGGAAGTECEWSGVRCNDANTTVTNLYLNFNGLTGTIQPAIADLPNLEELSLAGAAFTGSIPTELGRLSKLRLLDLSYDNFGGPLPAFFGSMTSLTDLYLHENRFTGSIPPELGNLLQLQTLDLGVNQLGGPIPIELARLTSLVYLDLDLNALTGQIPPALGQLRNLQYLSLSENKLDGQIPRELGNLTQLQQLLMAGNQLTGTIPDEIYTLRQLVNLGLEANKLTGGISPAIGNLTALTQLDLNTNGFTGAIPAEINSLHALTELNLQENSLSGPIPASLDGLTSIVTLDFGSNQLTGAIPTSLGNLRTLEYLALYDNKLGGTLPDSMRNLVNLKEINVAYDQLSGPIPDWLFQFANIDTVILANNAFTGPLPSTLTGAVNLQYLDLGGNQLTGTIPSDIGRLQKLEYVTLNSNEISGTIPDSFWTLAQLLELNFSSMQLTGPLPAAIRNLTTLTVANFQDNALSGPLPPELGSLSNLELLSLGSNEFTGMFPRELGQLKKLQAVDFSANNFRSPVPSELMGMTALVDGGVDFSYNALSASDATLLAFMNRVQFDHDFAHTQTVMPTAISAGQTTDRSAVVNWTPIQYTYDEGGYRVFASLTPGGAPVAVATTASKEISSITVRGLQPSTTYYFTVATVTHPHDFQHNLIVSDVSAAVSATTGPRQLAPADVVLTATPTGLVQLDGAPQNEDSFTLTNFGDIATSITLELFDNDFFDVTPKQFTLAGGASQIVKVTSIPKQPPGVRYGGVVPRGDGTSDDDIATTTLLSAARAGGNAIAEPLTNRIEIAAAAGIDPVGQVTFRNKGTATLIGILVADVPWLVPNTDPITIEPGSSAFARFKVIRARRPAGVTTGALTGTLSLIYVGALPETASAIHIDDTTPPSGVSISKVTVIDVSKPDVGSASAPGLATGEVAYFIAGLLDRSSATSSLASDLHIVNAFGSKPVSDVRLYYTSSAQKAVATLSTLGSAQGVSLANIVGNVYGESDQIGSIQVRSVDWQNLLVNANFLRSTAFGTLLGDMPVFRSDRALLGKDKLYLTGIAQSSNVHATAVLEEIAGTAAAVSIDFLDTSGAVSQHRDVQLPASTTTEITDVPANAATMIVTNATTSTPTGVLAYVRMSDDSSGDTWSVVDWSRAYKYRRTEAVRLPLVVGGGGSGKRRAVKHSDSASPRAITSATLFNSGSIDARVKLSAGTASKEIAIAARQTLTLSDVSSFLGTTSAESVVIEPLRGEVAAASRIATGATGTAVPVVSSQSGLRVGQSQVFSGLEDSAAYRTDYGFVETGGAPTTIRATLLLSDARSLFTTFVSREFRVDSGGFVLVNELVKSILGTTRSTYGDLHNLQLQLEVTEGSGSILPFVTITDNVTGDTILRLE